MSTMHRKLRRVLIDLPRQGGEAGIGADNTGNGVKLSCQNKNQQPG